MPTKKKTTKPRFTKHKLKKQQEKEDYPNQFKWKALFRGSLLSTTINKHVSYVGLADKRAQGIITLNAILIPIAISGGQNPAFKTGAIIAVISAVLCSAAAMYSIYPKPYNRQKGDHPLLLHFSQIKNLPEKKYLELMRESLSDTSILAEMAVQDLYHISKHILHPKFLWLKVSYGIFFFGYIAAIVAIGWEVL